MGVVRLAILCLPFRFLSAVLGKYMQESPVTEDNGKLLAAKRIGRLIETASRYTPWESKCLVQAIVGKLMLRRRGVANTLYLGTAREGQRLVAHAWLRCGDVIITGGYGCKRFISVGNFADV